VLVYAVSAPLAWFARRVIKGIKHVGLANIIAEKCGIEAPMPELLQEAFTPEAVSEILGEWLSDGEARDRAAAGLAAAMERLKFNGCAMESATAEILECAKRRIP
jgi:lipid A disaccharide synthetase